MRIKFNWGESTAESELVLEGDISDNKLSPITSLFIDNLTRVIDLDSLPPQITVADMRGKFKAWQESTSTSPSGRHLSRYKLLFKPIDSRLEKHDRTKFSKMQEDIAHLYCNLINYGITHRYSSEIEINCEHYDSKGREQHQNTQA